MFGIGSTEMLGVVVTGEIWLRVPQTIAMDWSGRLAARRLRQGHDAVSMIARFGMNGADYQAVEFTGDAVRALSMQERMTLCNMSAELGAQTGLVAPDDATTQQWLAGRPARRGPCPAARCSPVLRPRHASGTRNTTFDAATLEPAARRPAQSGAGRAARCARRHPGGHRLHRRLHRRQAG
jgi:3-isopropylmalate/(R)-2-methylmalate dehydratase large subunit